jgi:hypothetical protein
MASILCRIEGNLIYLRNQGIRVVVPSKCHQPASRPLANRGFPEMAVAVGPFVAGLDQHPNGTGPQDSSLRGHAASSAVNRPVRDLCIIPKSRLTRCIRAINGYRSLGSKLGKPKRYLLRPADGARLFCCRSRLGEMK